MKQTKSLPIQALINAVAGGLYIFLVAWLMFNVVQFFPKEDTFLAPATFLLLFVVSAAIEGSLILGQPIMLYLDGKKIEAMKLLSFTIAWLFVITVLTIGWQLVK